MEHSQKHEELLKRYLLGSLEEDEQQRLEHGVLTNDEYFEELLIVEDELVDSYLRGSLSPKERESFEQHFLTTAERKRKLDFSKAFRRHLANTTTRQSGQAIRPDEGRAFWKRLIPTDLFAAKPLRRLSLATILLIVAAGASWLFVSGVWRNQSTPGSSNIAVILSPGRLRSTGEIKKVAIAPGISAVHLQLELARDEFLTYQAVVQTNEGVEILTAAKLEPKTVETRRVVMLDLPARLLAAGDYQVKLSGMAARGESEDVGRYYFRVVVADT